MTRILDQAVERLRELPDTRQDQIGKWLLDVIEQDTSIVQLTAGQREEISRRVKRNEQPATASEAAAVLNKIT